VSVASACLIPGSVTEGVAVLASGDSIALSVEHPTGEFTVELRRDNDTITGCGLLRTARVLFDGDVLIP
jgi:4-oxalomesaconate tautomerase